MTPAERKLARNARARELRRSKYSASEWNERKAMQARMQRIKEKESSLNVGGKVVSKEKQAEIAVKAAADRAAREARIIARVEELQRKRQVEKATRKTIAYNGRGSIIMTRLDDKRHAVVNPMSRYEYDIIRRRLEKNGIAIVRAEGEELKYFQALGVEASYENGRIVRIGETPSRATLFEEIIHSTQAKKFGEINEIGTPERAAREIAANRMLLKHKKAYRLDNIDVEDTERNFRFWEAEFERLAGITYDRSDFIRDI